MPGPVTPTRDSGPPSPAGGPASERAGGKTSNSYKNLDPLTLPVNRGPRGNLQSENVFDREFALDEVDADDADAGGVDAGEVDEADAEILDSAQPAGEDGVTEDMSSLAINPANLNPGDLERLGEAESQRSELHLNGDFAQMDDAAIMLELKAGNMAGFDFLIQKYRKPIINFMYRMTRNQAVAEELAQEVFLRVYRSRETYRAEARFSTWLYRIATNLGVNQARDTRHERSASTIYLDETDSETGTTPDVADSTPDVESKLLRDERMAAIREHVMALPERQRMAVLMHKYEGMDYNQIGEVLKLSESATKSLLFRAYQTLREKLKGFV